MKRTTVILPEEIEARLRREARRRGTSIAEVAREALDAYLPGRSTERRLSFTGVGESEFDDTARHAEEIVAELISRRHP